MSVAIAFAQTTMALREVLRNALRHDAGWRMTGGAPRITVLPHGKPDKGSGERLNLGMVAASPNLQFRNQLPGTGPDEAAPLVFDLRYLITVHVLFQLHAELLIGTALEALHATPVLRLGQPITAGDDPLEASIMAGEGVAPDQLPRISVEIAEARSFDILRVPALLVHVSPIVVTPPRPLRSVLIER